VYVKWKRGSKSENGGSTDQAAIDDASRVATFPSKPIEIVSTILREGADKYESKPLNISVYQVTKKKESAIGKAVFDLSEYISNMGQGTNSNSNSTSLPLPVAYSVTDCRVQVQKKWVFH
jgi:uncharacterized protein YheU (UPF0270 family)